MLFKLTILDTLYIRITLPPPYFQDKVIRSEGSPILSNTENQEKPAIGFFGALKIPVSTVLQLSTGKWRTVIVVLC